MNQSIPAPIDGLSLNTMVLPSRANLLSVRDVLCGAHRAGLKDAVGQAKKASERRAGDDQIAVSTLDAVWECVAALELAATVAAPWVVPQLNPTPSGVWIEMSRYDPGRANRFYESSHNWTDQRFASISAHRQSISGESLIDAFAWYGRIPEEVVEALHVAEQATSSFLRKRFLALAEAWTKMRAYAAAFEHGLLLVPAEYGRIDDENGKEIPHAIVIWETRKDSAKGHFGDSVTAAIEGAQYAGNLAIDLASYVCDARLRFLEALDFSGPEVALKTFDIPFTYWIESGDLSAETIQILDTARVSWLQSEDQPPES